MKKYSFISLLSILVVILMLTLSFQGQKVNVTGTWNMVVQTDNGSGNPVLVLKHVNDSVLTGSYTGQFGTSELKGLLRGNKISVRILISELPIDYVGTVEGNEMKGRVVFGSYGEGTFTGRKKVE